MGAWIVGHNLTGYLPESEPYAYETHAEAVQGLIDEMRQYADSDDDAAWQGFDSEPLDDETPSMLATVDSIVQDEIKSAHDATGELGFIVEDNNGRSISFWLQYAEDVDADEYNSELS